MGTKLQPYWQALASGLEGIDWDLPHPSKVKEQSLYEGVLLLHNILCLRNILILFLGGSLFCVAFYVFTSNLQ